MKRTSLCRIGIRLIAVLAGIFILPVVLINFFPEKFITIGIYGVLHTQRDYAINDHTYNRVLVIGDSLAQVSYMPSVLSEDTYNYGIGNETIIDGYYRLLEYLENHGKPEYIFCSYNPTEFGSQSGVWDTALYQRGISLGIARQIMRDAKSFGSDSGLLRNNAQMQVLAYYYGFHPDSIRICLKGIYKNIFMDESCYERYSEQVTWVTEHKGHWKHYMEGQDGADVHEKIASADVTEFYVTDIADFFMRKILDLCRKEKIGVIVETIPFNEATYVKTNSQYLKSYQAYWDNIQDDYPEVTINSDITYYENRYFADCFHFNGEGTEKFSEYIKEKYAGIFEES